MLTTLVALSIQVATPALPQPAFPDPTPEALALGKRLAATGGLATMIPMVVEKDLGELAGEAPDLTATDKARLYAIGHARRDAGLAALTDAMGLAYARRLSVADLKILVAQNENPATGRWRQATPLAVAEAMAALGQIDLKKETAAAFCAETRKLCARK